MGVENAHISLARANEVLPLARVKRGAPLDTVETLSYDTDSGVRSPRIGPPPNLSDELGPEGKTMVSE